MRNCYSIILLSLLAFTFSCSSGKKALQKGNYPDAVFKSIERLRSNPDNKNARATLQNAYPLAINTLTTEIDEILTTNQTDKYAAVAERYQLLQNMASEIRRSPAALSIITSPRSFSTQLAAAKDKAAFEAYDRGMTLIQIGDREAALDAIVQFERVLSYDSSFKNAREMLEKATRMATIYVVIEPISVPSRYKVNANFFQSDLLDYMNRQNRYVRFLSSREANRIENIDHVLEMEFFDFQIGATKDKSTEKEYTSRDSVKVGSAVINGRKVDVLNKVKATLTTHKRSVSSSGLLQVRIIDTYSKKVLTRRQLPGTFVWETEWASYNGDERALTAEQLRLCKQKPGSPPNAQDLFYEFTKPIFNQTKSYLRSFYRKY